MNLKILLTGADGQLGTEIVKRAPAWAKVFPMTFEELDIRSLEKCFAAVQDVSPDWIINAAAYTDVEKAEIEPEQAMKTNELGPENLAQVANARMIKLLHISTDFVFDGSLNRPYVENDFPNPLNSYGRSKLAGEKAISRISGNRGLIIRTSWLYSSHGRNFVKTILRLLAEKPFLTVINDQTGTPTSVRSLANVIFHSISLDLTGLFHWCDAGTCSWYDFAVEIQNQALDLGLIKTAKEIRPVSSAEFASRVTRPAWSVLDQKELAKLTGLDPLPWQSELKLVLEELC